MSKIVNLGEGAYCSAPGCTSLAVMDGLCSAHHDLAWRVAADNEYLTPNADNPPWWYSVWRAVIARKARNEPTDLD